MKTILAVLTVLALCCAGLCTSLAEDSSDVFSLCGGSITFTRPESMKNLQGSVETSEQGEVTAGSGIYNGSIIYCTKSEKEFDALINEYIEILSKNPEDVTDEDQQRYAELYDEISRTTIGLFELLTVSNGQTLEEIAPSVFGESLLQTYDYMLLGTSGEYSHYLLWLRPDSEVRKSLSISDPYKEEYEKLIAGRETVIASLALGEPEIENVNLSDAADFSLKVKDLNGNPVDLKEVFAQHEVTMVNFWATYCGPCLQEMPELEELNREVGKDDCAIIGICTDIRKDKTENAKSILMQAGVSYLNYYASAEALAPLQITGVPTSYFVSRDGKILTEPVVGASMFAYRNMFSRALQLLRK